jgi:two-component system, LytTR family, sensor kinase
VPVTEPTAPELPADVRVRWRVVFGVAAALIVLFTIQNYLTPVVQRGTDSFARTFALQVIVWTTWVVLSPIIFAAARRWRRDLRLTVGAVVRQFLVSLGVALLHAALAGTVRWTLGLSIATDLPVVIVNSMVANLGANILRYWLIASAYHAVAYHHEVRARDVRAARLEASLVQAKLDRLQSRLQPHFLFNTMNSIGALIHEQPAAAEQMLGSLSELLRASLNAEPAREVTLQCELELLRQYVSIQQMRFQDRLRVSIETAPDALNAYVPHLVLQPLVENAIRHGIAPREAAGHVRVAAGRDGENLKLIVEDDGMGEVERGSSSAAGGFGLAGTRARLQHLYGGSAKLELKPRTPTGVVATVQLPFHTSPLAAEASV